MAKQKETPEVANDNTTKQVGGLEVSASVPTKVINGIEFIVADEAYRMYEFPNGRQLEIRDVKYINVSKSRGHRLVCADGTMFYIKPNESWYMVFRKYPYEDNNFTF